MAILNLREMGEDSLREQGIDYVTTVTIFRTYYGIGSKDGERIEEVVIAQNRNQAPSLPLGGIPDSIINLDSSFINSPYKQVFDRLWEDSLLRSFVEPFPLSSSKVILHEDVHTYNSIHVKDEIDNFRYRLSRLVE